MIFFLYKETDVQEQLFVLWVQCYHFVFLCKPINKIELIKKQKKKRDNEKDFSMNNLKD